MKKFIVSTFACLAALMGAVAPANAQMMPQQLPTDPDTRIGKLSNGLTYYIRHNEKPAGQADFYIAQKVGSVQEQPNQLGLAHFLEHMCFNGSKHFPDSMVTTWLETVGVKFGANLNAYTWVDQTVYNISSVPVARTSVQDSCLLILRDWAGDLLLTTKEIDKQRAVIHEEWRMRGDANFRMTEAALPEIYGADSRYATAMPIGTMEIVDNFPEQALRDYYHTWYRPDLQAIIVVGDIDVDRIEGKIKEMFADLSVPEGAPKREYPPVPDFEGTRYSLHKDKEASANVVRINYLMDRLPDEMMNTEMYYATDYMMSMISAMVSQRLEEMATKPDCPFSYAGCYYGPFFYSTRVKDALTFAFVPKEHDAYPSYEAIHREILRATKGFSSSEYERAKANYLAGMEQAYNNRNSRTNEQFVNEYVDNFLDGTPIPGIELDWQIAQAYAAQLPVDVINQVIAQAVTDNNRVVIAFMVDSPDLVMPTAEGLSGIEAKVGGENIEGYVDETRTDPLLPKLPKKGKIKKESRDEAWDATVWDLSNGARVVVRPTKFKEDQILMNAYAMGGTELLPEKFDNAVIFDDMFNANGLGTYNSQDLSKYLAGKNVGVSIGSGLGMREINGSSTPKDLAQMMELVYMTFTAPYYDPTEFAAMQAQIIPLLKSQENQPNFQFSKLATESLYDSPRRKMPTAEIVEAVTPELYYEAVKLMTENAADYTFVFTGNIDLNEFRPLVEQYIASLPGNPKTAVKAIGELPEGESMKAGSFDVTKAIDMETPQTYVQIIETADMPYEPIDALTASIAGEVLTKRLVDKIRQQMGAVYSIGASGSMSRLGKRNVKLGTAFPMKPEMKAAVLDTIKSMIAELGNEITAEEYAGVIEVMAKNYKEGLEKNEPWLNAYISTQINGKDAYHTYLDNLAALTPEKVMDFVRRLNAQNGLKVVVLDPTEAPAAPAAE